MSVSTLVSQAACGPATAHFSESLFPCRIHQPAGERRHCPGMDAGQVALDSALDVCVIYVARSEGLARA